MNDRFDTVHDEESIGEELCPICDSYYRPFITDCDCDKHYTKHVNMSEADFKKMKKDLDIQLDFYNKLKMRG